MTVDPRIAEITDRIRERSAPTREPYVARIMAKGAEGPKRSTLTCGNLAHGFAACGPLDKSRLSGDQTPNLGIITAYNDMLSAHQPFERYPELIREAGSRQGEPKSPGAILGAALAIDLEMSRGAPLEEAVQRARVHVSLRPAFLSAGVRNDEAAAWIRRKIDADQLQAGLVLDEDVFLKSGNLIVKRDTELTAPLAARLQAFHRNMGLQEPIRVRVRAGHDLDLE